MCFVHLAQQFKSGFQLTGQPSAIAARMVIDPDDALFIENERCVQFPPLLERGGQDTNWHLVTARRADKLRPPRPRVEHGDALDRIMQPCTERGKIIAE